MGRFNRSSPRECGVGGSLGVELWGFDFVGKDPRLGSVRGGTVNQRVAGLFSQENQSYTHLIADHVDSTRFPIECDGVDKEFRSLVVHSQYFKRTSTVIPPDSERDAVMRVMEEAYAPAVWRLPDDYLSYEAFERALRRLDNTSSPGYPYLRRAGTVGEWLEFDGIWYSQRRVDELWYEVGQLIDHVGELVLRVFVKEEPHSLKKVREERWRLIMAFPLSWQVLGHMLFCYGNDAEIECCYDIPSQQGLRMTGGGWKQYRDQWESRGYDVGLDKSAWDWHCPYYIMNWDLELTTRLGRGRKMAEWSTHARWFYDWGYVRPYIILSDGSIFQQIVPGVMKSGSVKTISTNSKGQIMMHVLGCRREGLELYPLPVAVGDDTLQREGNTPSLETFAELGLL